MGYIYKITNTTNNKCYIGETIQVPEKRWKDHKNAIKRGGGCSALKAAFKKYGVNNFTFKVLIICFDEDRLIYEKQYIQKYNSQVPNGYNILAGGQEGMLGFKHSEETKKKIGEISKNKSEEVRERARQVAILFNKTHNIAELQRKSEKWQKALKEGRIGGGGYKNKSKEQIQEVKNKIREGVNRYFQNNGSPINREKHSQIMTKINGRKVNQYNKDKVFIASYDSIKIASNKSGVDCKNIQSNTSGRSKTAGGYIWEYADKELKE
jgi:group I intron endonuclease